METPERGHEGGIVLLGAAVQERRGPQPSGSTGPSRRGMGGLGAAGGAWEIVRELAPLGERLWPRGP